MKNRFLPVIFLFLSYSVLAQNVNPVTPNASKEVVALLQLLYQLRGKHMLSGQHNFPISRGKNSAFASDYIGKTPVVWSQDFGFSKEGDKDSYLSRPDIVDEAIRQHKMGSIITLCWHAVPPTADEPVTFQPLRGSDSTRLASVQGNLTEQQFRDLFKKGTPTYKKWVAQVDEIAKYLKQLQDAHVPVLWRPYHEMNGDWFWWGGIHEGKYTTRRLYQQIFDRLVKHHKLNNLVWMWSVDRASRPGREFENYYPGDEYLDVVSLDVYGSDFNQKYYDDLQKLANGKPMVLGEVGVPPTLDVLESQPDWTLYVIWSGMTRLTPKKQYNDYLNDERVLFMEDQKYLALTAPFREVSGLPVLNFVKEADFTGTWVLNKAESSIQNSGFSGDGPYKMNIIQVEDVIAVESFTVVEWGDDNVEKQLIKTDGSDMKSIVFSSSQKVQNANWSASKDVLTITSNTKLNFGENPVEIRGTDVWISAKKGKQLVIEKNSTTFQGGEVHSVLVFDRQ